MEPTGIKVLDDLLGGGLPRPSAVGVIGAVGSGKSSLVRQLAVTMLERDFRVLYYAIDESAEDVRESVSSYGIDVNKYETEGRLSFIDIFALGVERLAEAYPVEEPEQIVDSTFKFSDLVAQGRSFTLKHLGKKQFVVMDSLTPFFLMVEAKRVFQFGQVPPHQSPRRDNRERDGKLRGCCPRPRKAKDGRRTPRTRRNPAAGQDGQDTHPITRILLRNDTTGNSHKHSTTDLVPVRIRAARNRINLHLYRGPDPKPRSRNIPSLSSQTPNSSGRFHSENPNSDRAASSGTKTIRTQQHENQEKSRVTPKQPRIIENKPILGNVPKPRADANLH